MKRFKIFLFNSLIVVTSSFLLQLIKLFFNIYLSNKISQEAFGVFQLITTVYIFTITLASSGINISCTKIVSEELALGNDYGVKKSAINCIKISIIVSVTMSFILFLTSNYIVQYCFEYKINSSVIYLISIALPFISICSAISGYFIAVRRVVKNVIGQFIEQIVKIIAILVLFNFFTNFNNIENVCYSLILGDIISEIIAFIYLFFVFLFDLNYNYSSLKSVNNNTFLSRILRTLIPIALTSYIKSGLSTIKQLIIPSRLEKSGTTSYEAFSNYGIISGMAMPIILFPATFIFATSNLLIPEFSRYYIKHNYKKIKYYTDFLLITTFSFSLLLSIVFFIFSNKISLIFYHNNDVGIYIKIFSLLIPFMYIDIVIDNILKGLNAQTNVMIINIIDSVLTTVFIFLFVPVLGIKGYILSIFISEILNMILSSYKILKLEKSMF